MRGTPETFHTREAWLEARRRGIGSSDVPAILGLSRYSSPLALYHEKRGVEVPEDRETEMRQIALLVEPVIAGLFERESQRQVIAPAPFSLVRSEVCPIMTASVDRWQIDPARLTPSDAHPDEIIDEARGVLELKNVSVFQASAWLDEGEVPLEYIVQVQHQLAVTGAPYASVAALIGGTQFKWTDIARDDELIALIRQKEMEFWGRVLDGRPPDADGSDATRETLRVLAEGLPALPAVSLPVDFIELDQRRVALKEDVKKAEAELQEIDNRIMAALHAGGGNTGLLPNGTRYTWKMQHREGFTTQPTDFPVLRRKGPKS